MLNKRIGLLAVFAVISLSGCAAFRQSVTEKDPEKARPLDAKYDASDLLGWADEMAKLILNAPFPPADSKDKPVVAELGIQNRTKDHLDTQALADTIVTKLMDSGKIDFVNTSRRDELLKEQGYQLANCTESTRSAIGKQLGAKYMLTGSIIEINKKSGREVRVSKTEDVYYQLTMELTDIESGRMLVRKQLDRMRSASKPIFGW